MHPSSRWFWSNACFKVFYPPYSVKMLVPAGKKVNGGLYLPSTGVKMMDK